MMSKPMEINIIALCLLALIKTTELVHNHRVQYSTQQWSFGDSGPLMNQLIKLLNESSIKQTPKSNVYKTNKWVSVESHETKCGRNPNTKLSGKSKVAKKCWADDDTSTTSSKIRDSCLNAHNKYRSIHNVTELVWDEEIAKFAQGRSDYMAANAVFAHIRGNKFGENLFYSGDPRMTCGEMVKGWYDEIKQYNFNNPGFSHGTGHFTQVIWRSTTKVGCGLATSTRGSMQGIFLTCNYDPHGNVIGQFPDNVPPKSSDVPKK